MNLPTIPAKTIVSSYTEGGWFGSNYNMRAKENAKALNEMM